MDELKYYFKCEYLNWRYCQGELVEPGSRIDNRLRQARLTTTVKLFEFNLDTVIALLSML